MTTYIGQASHDENNKYTGGKAGNQTGTELNSRAAYLYNWHTLIRFKDANRALKCGQAMAAAVANVNIGYDQWERNTILPLARKANWDLSKITTPCECDCSSLAGVCGIAAGIPESVLYVDGNMCYTGNQVQRFKNSGMVNTYTSSDYVNSTSKWQVGDILVSNSHTVVVISGPVAAGGTSNEIDGMSIEELAQAVIAGRFGTGDARKAALGDKYDAVQKRVNEILSGASASTPSKSIEEIAREVIAGQWGNGDDRKAKLAAAGYNYDEVQKKVNELVSGNSSNSSSSVGSVSNTMLGIDVSSHDKQPFKAETEAAYKDAKFVIVKATQGTSYTNDCFDYAYNRAKNDGKCLGTYHYAAGGDAVAEAQYYYNKVKHTIGEAIPVVDWEQYSNNSWGSTDWVYKFVTKFHELAGIYPFIYTGSYNLNQVANCKDICPLWVAGYPKNENNWNVPNFPYSISPWKSYTIWQFTSGGDVVDRNTTPWNATQWKEYAAKGKVTGGSNNSNSNSTSVDIDQLARDVIAGKYGTGDARKKALGANYDAVQKRVNELLGATSSKKPVTDAVVNDVINGKYGNGDVRKSKLEAAGYDYAEVQAAVNKKLNSSSVDIDKLAREVIAGKYGDGEARKKALGSNYAAVQKRVNELLS